VLGFQTDFRIHSSLRASERNFTRGYKNRFRAT